MYCMVEKIKERSDQICQVILMLTNHDKMMVS